MIAASGVYSAEEQWMSGIWNC